METITAKQARLDPSVRAAMKKQQMARLALKEKLRNKEITAEDYSTAYAAQPAQVAKAADHAANAAERAAIRNAKYEEAIANATGGADAFKGA